MKKYLLLFYSAFCVLTSAFSQTPTWSQDIAPILYANCTKCHHTGGAGHFSLMTFADAYTYGFQMETATTDRVMPPWTPDENYKHFARERVLSQTDIDKIAQWVAGGRLQGNPTLAPAQPTYTNTSALGTVDLTVRIPTYTVTTNSDVYRNFPITTTVPAGRYITGIEVIPGNTHIVHHVIVFHDSTSTPATLDANDPGPGYDNAGGTGSLASSTIAAWTPGSSPYYAPVSTGFRLPANTNIVVQVHYPAGSIGLTDSTRVNFKLTTVPQREISVVGILNHLQSMSNGPINIPANTTRTYYEDETIPVNLTVLTAFPHMHLIGKTIKSWANKTTAPFDTVRFVNIPDWDFNWQDTYVFPNAVRVPSGYKWQAVATYDNTTNNLNNPNNPPQLVTAGESTTDEMMIVGFGIMPYQTGDEDLIIDRRIIAHGATTFCSGQSVVLKMIEGTGYTYQWFRNGNILNNASSFSYTATLSGNYSAQISLGNNSSLTDTIAVTVAVSPTATVTPAGSTAICPGNTVALNASTGSGYTYQWFNNGTPIANATSSSYTASTAGSYTVQIYNGCYSTSSAVSITTSGPVSTITPIGLTTFCQGGSVTLSAPAGLTYLWSTNATSQNIVVTQAGSYTVTVTDGNNCSGVSSATTVTVNTSPTASITANGATSFCPGGSVTLSAPAGMTYNWSNNDATQSINVTQSGSYIVTITNANNCSAVSSATTVNVYTPPSATITPGGATSFCSGGSVLLTVAASSSYLWSDNATTQSITVNQTGTYLVTVTDANSCTSENSIGITVHPTPDATVTPDRPTTICPGESVTLSAEQGMSYNWSNNATTQSIVVAADGDFTVTVTDNNSCSATSTPITVTISNTAVAGITALGSTTFCEGGSVDLTASNGISYLWSTSETTNSITVDASGTYTVTVTVSGSCTAISVPLTVVVHPNPPVPVITTSGNTTFCEGGSLNLAAPIGYSYLWNSNETTQSVTITQIGTYTYGVIVTDANSCSAVSDTITVIVNPLPVVTFFGNAGIVCTDDPPYSLIGESPSGGTFSGPGVTGNMLDPVSAGLGVHTITYTYTDNYACTSSATDVIEVAICSGIAKADGWSFIISPNPSNGNFTMEWKGLDKQYTQMKVVDISGKVIYVGVLDKSTTQIDLGGVPSGCYLLQSTSDKETIYRKLIIQQ